MILFTSVRFHEIFILSSYCKFISFKPFVQLIKGIIQTVLKMLPFKRVDNNSNKCKEHRCELRIYSCI